MARLFAYFCPIEHSISNSTFYDSFGMTLTNTLPLTLAGTLPDAPDAATPLFASGVTPVPGLITQVIEDDGGFGYTTTYKDFDALGNPQTIIFPGGHPTTSTYDVLGRLVTDINVNGIVTRYEYDDRGSVLRKVFDYTADGVTGDNVVTTYEYDSDGRLLYQRTAADGLVIESYSRNIISIRWAQRDEVE